MRVPPDGRPCRAARTALLLSSRHPATSNLLPQIANGNKKERKRLDWEAVAEKNEADTENHDSPDQHLRRLARTEKCLFVCSLRLPLPPVHSALGALPGPGHTSRQDGAPCRRGSARSPGLLAGSRPTQRLTGWGKPGGLPSPGEIRCDGG